MPLEVRTSFSLEQDIILSPHRGLSRTRTFSNAEKNIHTKVVKDVIERAEKNDQDLQKLELMRHRSFESELLLDANRNDPLIRPVRAAFSQQFKGLLADLKHLAIATNRVSRNVEGELRILARRQVRRQFGAEIVIQRYLRGYLARRRARQLKKETQEKALRLMNTKATVIQTAFRNWKKRTSMMASFRKEVAEMRTCLNWACRIIQSRFRGWKARRIFSALKEDRYRQLLTVAKWLEIRKQVVSKHGKDMDEWLHKLKQFADMVKNKRLQLEQEMQIQFENTSATTIQKTFRGYRQRHLNGLSISRVRIVVTRLQSRVRVRLARKTATRRRYNLMRFRSIAKVVVLCSRLQKFVRNFRHWKTQLESHAATTIQRSFLGYRERKIRRNDFYMLREKAICIQRFTRGFHAKQHVAAKYHALHRVRLLARTMVQTVRAAHRFRKTVTRFRMELAQKANQAAIVIQKHVRGHQERVLQKISTDLIRGSAIRIQADFKRFSAVRRYRKRLAYRRKMYILIIAMISAVRWRKILVQVRIRKSNHCASVLQKHIRGHLVRKSSQLNFKLLKKKVIQTQSLWRRRTAKRFVSVKRNVQQRFYQVAQIVRTVSAFQRVLFRVRSRRNQAATVIQKSIRGYKERVMNKNSFSRIKRSAIYIQAMYRGKSGRQAARKRIEYLNRVRRVVAFVRCFLKLRTRFDVIRLILESRKSMERKLFEKRTGAAVNIQRRIRGNRVRELLGGSFKDIRFATVTVQRFIRKVQRQMVVRKEQAWRRLKTVTSLVLCSCRLLRYLHRVRIVMEDRHMQELARIEKENKQKEKENKAATTIAACAKGFLIRVPNRLSVHRLRTSASIAQRLWRGHTARQKTTAKRSSVRKFRVLVTVIRGYLCFRRQLHHMRAVVKFIDESVTRIQKVYRGGVVRVNRKQSFVKQRSSAIALQSVMRGYWARKDVKRKRALRLGLSVCVFVYLAFVKYRKILLRVRAAIFARHTQAATTIQRHIRGYIERTVNKNCVSLKRSKSKMIQSIWRGCQARNRCTAKRLVLFRFRSLVRVLVACNRFINRIVLTRHASTIIQRHIRGYLQRCVRGLSMPVCRKQTIRIQSLWRQYKAKNILVHKRDVRRTFTTVVRVLMAYNRFRSRVLLPIRQASVIIQRNIRGYLQRCVRGLSMPVCRKQTIRIQSLWRQYKAKNVLTHKRDVRKRFTSIVLVLVACNRFINRSILIRYASTIIQRHIRGYLQRSVRGLSMPVCRKQTIRIQSLWRQYKAKNVLAHKRDVRKNMMAVFYSVLGFVRFKRNILNPIRESIQLRFNSVLRIQKLIRGRTDRLRYQGVKKDIITVQSLYRKRNAQKLIEKKRMLRQRWNSVLAPLLCFMALRYRLAAQRRRTQERTAILAKQTHSAVVMQSLWRGRSDRQLVARKQSARRSMAVVGLSVFMFVRFRKLVFYNREVEKFLNACANRIQKVYRGYQVRDVQALALPDVKKRLIKVQAAWRGSKARELVIHKLYNKRRFSVLVLVVLIFKILCRHAQRARVNIAKRHEREEEQRRWMEAEMERQKQRREAERQKQIEFQRKRDMWDKAIKIQSIWRSFQAKKLRKELEVKRQQDEMLAKMAKEHMSSINSRRDHFRHLRQKRLEQQAALLKDPQHRAAFLVQRVMKGYMDRLSFAKQYLEHVAQVKKSSTCDRCEGNVYDQPFYACSNCGYYMCSTCESSLLKTQFHELSHVLIKIRQPPLYKKPVMQKMLKLPDFYARQKGLSYVHGGLSCLICERYITGIRVKCGQCPHYNICIDCDKAGHWCHPEKHPESHIFLHIPRPMSTEAERALVDRMMFSANRMDEEDVLEEHYKCTLCREDNLQELRYTCSRCEGLHLCEKCYEKESTKGHPESHVFLRIPAQHSRFRLSRFQRDFFAGLYLQGEFLHGRTRCKLCRAVPINDVRWRCVNCADFDVCSNCEKKNLGKHCRNHAFFKFRYPLRLPTGARVPQGYILGLTKGILDPFSTFNNLSKYQRRLGDPAQRTRRMTVRYAPNELDFSDHGGFSKLSNIKMFAGQRRRNQINNPIEEKPAKKEKPVNKYSDVGWDVVEEEDTEADEDEYQKIKEKLSNTSTKFDYEKAKDKLKNSVRLSRRMSAKRAPDSSAIARLTSQLSQDKKLPRERHLILKTKDEQPVQPLQPLQRAHSDISSPDSSPAAPTFGRLNGQSKSSSSLLTTITADAVAAAPAAQLVQLNQVDDSTLPRTGRRSRAVTFGQGDLDTASRLRPSRFAPKPAGNK